MFSVHTTSSMTTPAPGSWLRALNPSVILPCHARALLSRVGYLIGVALDVKCPSNSLFNLEISLSVLFSSFMYLSKSLRLSFLSEFFFPLRYRIASSINSLCSLFNIITVAWRVSLRIVLADFNLGINISIRLKYIAGSFFRKSSSSRASVAEYDNLSVTTKPDERSCPPRHRQTESTTCCSIEANLTLILPIRHRSSICCCWINERVNSLPKFCSLHLVTV